MGTIQSADEFYHLRTSDNSEEYYRSAHDDAPEEVWRDIITRYPDMRKWVVHNKSIPISILELLADDVDWQVRHMIAMKRKLPEHLQVRLAQDADEGVRRALVHNARATVRTLTLLTNDEVEEIREHARARLDVISDIRGL